MARRRGKDASAATQQPPLGLMALLKMEHGSEERKGRKRCDSTAPLGLMRLWRRVKGRWMERSLAGNLPLGYARKQVGKNRSLTQAQGG